MTRRRPQEPHVWLGMRQASVQILTRLPANHTALGKSLKLLHLENEGFGKDCTWRQVPFTSAAMAPTTLPDT